MATLDETLSNYLLPRNLSERERLNGQHIYLKKFAYDDRLVYDQNVLLGEGSSVLDSGTGTVAWLLDLAKEVPQSVELVGVDVSANNFPDAGTLPGNVHLSLASATDLPKEWTNKFDLVNQRFMISALLEVEWPKVLSEIFRVLKPGATVQLCELDPRYPVEKPPALARHGELLHKAANKRGLLRYCARELPRMLQDAGFVDVVDEGKPCPVGKPFGKWGEQGAKGPAGAWWNMKHALVEQGTVSSAKEYDDLLDELVKEWDEKGIYLVARMICATKPLER